MKNYLEEKKINVLLFNESKGWEDSTNNIYKINSYKKFIFKISFMKADVIHFHSIDIRIRILLGIFKLFGKKVILTIHGESLYNQLINSNKFVQYLLLNSLKRIDKIICVNSKIVNNLIYYGINRNKLIQIPAYINPIEDENDSNKIPKEVWNFINNSKFLISANGWVRFNNNEDLYGLDILIEILNILTGKGKEVKLIIALLGFEDQNEEERKYYNELKQKISEMKLQNHIYIYEVKDTEFYPILKKSQLFLRPTNTDGDSISVREALYYKIPTIASDVVRRPESAILFKNRNIKDLYNITIDVIENYHSYKDKLKNIIIENNAEKILDVYKEIVRR